MTVRTILGGSSRVVCNVVGWEEKVWTILAIELSVCDWFFTSIEQEISLDPGCITTGDVFSLHCFITFFHAVHFLLVGIRNLA